MSVQMTVGQRLDRLPNSSFHRRTLALIGAGMFFDGFDIYLAAGVLGAMVRDGFSTVQNNAWFLSCTFLGMMIGAWVSGILGDRYGRRFSYQFNLALFGLASLAAAFAPSIMWLSGFRFIMGLGLGAEIVLGYATLSEFVPPATRGKAASIMHFCTNSALMVATFGGWLIIPYLGWRWMFAIAGVGAGIVWLMRKNMPESPRWLESKGRIAEADALTRVIETEALGREPDVTPARLGVAPVVPRTSVTQLFQGRLLRRTITGISINVINNLITHGFIGWMPTFFVKEGMTVTSSLGYTAIMTLGAPVGSVLGYAMSESVGRKWGTVVLSIAACALGLVYPHMTDPVPLLTVGFFLVVMIFAVGALSIAAYVPELFPTSVRMRGVGLCSTTGRLANVGIPFLVTALYISYGLTGVLALISGGFILQALIVATIGIETRGRSLEEVDAEDMLVLQPVTG
ncbi:MFS transporter [Acidisphaera sp. L21]|uniref:MFS transporter n=1 Tax=Acidisphaera sp. L21 TaxID=1641851 RepID=UPI00131A9420|nr:MFS transporter [Acidisphaera sp. L21]